MSAYFLDTSALVKRYIDEQGTEWIQSIVSSDAGHNIFIAQITRAEIVSAASRRKREGTVTARTVHAIRLMVDRHARQEYREIGLADQIIQRAQDLLEVYPLRAYDAVQLACALEVNIGLESSGFESLIFISSDLKLLETAGLERLSTVNPEDQA